MLAAGFWRYHTALRDVFCHLGNPSLICLCLQIDPYWTVQTLTARERSRISNQTVCSLLEMLRLVARSNSSALIRVRRPPPGHPRSQSWFMDTLWAVQKSGLSQKRVSL